MNFKKKIILTFFGLVFVNQSLAMFLPYYMPMYATSTVIISNTTPDKLTRTWLNWLYSQNCSITSSSDVRSNIDYYHDMIQKHYKYLLFKKENTPQIKRLKLKSVAQITAISVAFLTGFFYFFHKIKDNPNGEMHAFLAIGCGFSSCFTFIVGCTWLRSLQKFDKVLNRSLKRDEHMLDQFEKYKAGSVAQNH